MKCSILMSKNVKLTDTGVTIGYDFPIIHNKRAIEICLNCKEPVCLLERRERVKIQSH